MRPVEVAVLGSARVGSGRPALRRSGAARRRCLPPQGWTVVTGGYGGLMGAVASGRGRGGRAHRRPADVARGTHLTPDASHGELRWSEDYAQRLAHLLAARVAVALPGGIGTLAEAAAVWAAAQTEPGTARLVLVGPAWGRLLDVVGDEFVVDADDLALPVHVESVDEVVPAVQRLLDVPGPVIGARG